MKTISSILLTCLLFFVFNFVDAQSFQLLPYSNASWLVQDRSSEFTLYSRYFVSENPDDTLINGQTYTKIFSEKNGTVIQYEGAFRSDDFGKTYYLPPNDFLQEESILQDLSKAVGDTVFNVAVHYGGYLGSYDFVVDSVMYYSCGPYNLKYLALHTVESIPYLGDFMVINWVEKIGNVFGGIFNSPSGGLNSYKLICHDASDTLFYTTPVFDYLPIPTCLVYRQGSCEFYLSTDKPMASEVFSIYPNPYTQSLSLLAGSEYRNIDLRVCDIMGRIVLAENIPVLSTEYKINFSSMLPKGIYILSINNQNKLLWKQMIVKD